MLYATLQRIEATMGRGKKRKLGMKATLRREQHRVRSVGVAGRGEMRKMGMKAALKRL